MDELRQGIVVATRGRLFEVHNEQTGRVKCEVRQKVKDEIKSTTPVAVGDDVKFTITSEGFGCIEKVLTRKTQFGRPAKGIDDKLQIIAANLDRLAIVVSVKSPALKTGLIDRFIIAAYIGQMEPFIIINKTDLETPDNLDLIEKTYRSLGYHIYKTSAEESTGLAELKEYLIGHRALFAGHSGVGKSSLLNKLIPSLDLKTRTISHYSNRGKHATTSIELFELPSGGYIADSPGLKVMGLWQVDKDELPLYYPDFEPYLGKCRFSSCSHIHEPDCAVKQAVESNNIAKFRYENYLAISESLSLE